MFTSHFTGALLILVSLSQVSTHLLNDLLNNSYAGVNSGKRENEPQHATLNTSPTPQPGFTPQHYYYLLTQLPLLPSPLLWLLPLPSLLLPPVPIIIQISSTLLSTPTLTLSKSQMVLHLCNRDSAVATCDVTSNFDKLHIYKHTRRKPQGSCCTSNTATNPTTKLRRFSFSEISTATSYFSPSSLLGKGSYGAVYSALLDNGTLLAAVKRSTNTQSPSPTKSPAPTSGAENEMEILSNLHYPRFVNLLGYTIDPTTTRVILVVEHMPNGSLYDLLHKTLKPPGWITRIRFALHIAKATLHLHTSNPPVIHRDIKSSNILIDGSGRARLGDFGLAVRGRMEDLRLTTTPPAGTLGYLDPSYLVPGDLSTKSDVFSFGILLLEIISGRRAMDFDYSPPSVVDWAVPLIKSGREGEICDERIVKCVDGMAVKMLAVIAAKCVRSKAEKRPQMEEVVEVIESALRRIKSPILCEVRRRVEMRSRTSLSSNSSTTATTALDLLDEDRCCAGETADVNNANKLPPVTVSIYSRPSMITLSSRSSRRKVSSVPTVNGGGTGGIGIKLEGRSGGVVIISRSRSAGSCSIGLVGTGGSSDSNDGAVVGLVKGGRRQRGQFGVRVAATVKLSKSRSTGGLRGGKINSSLRQESDESGSVQSKVEVDVLPLLVAGVPTTEEEQKDEQVEKNQNQIENVKVSKSTI